MANWSPLTDNQIKVIQRNLMNATWWQTQFLGFFRAHKGLIKPVGRGIVNHTTTQWERINPGEISVNLQNLPDSHGRLTTTDSVLCMLATKVTIPLQLRDAWKSNNLVGGGDMVQATINQQLMAFYNQVDQFICHGDLMKTPLGNDPMAGAGKFTGIFNGFTDIGGGAGTDDDMTAAGDFIATVVNMIAALKTAGFEPEQYYIMSDVATWQASQVSNSLYTSNIPTTEYQAIMARPDIAAWIHSINAQDSSSNNMMLMTSPYTSLGEPAYRLLTGYDFDVYPLYNGGLGPNMSFELGVVWSGAIEQLHATAIQNTDDLTFTSG
jgi:hypothetical protein